MAIYCELQIYYFKILQDQVEFELNILLSPKYQALTLRCFTYYINFDAHNQFILHDSFIR